MNKSLFSSENMDWETPKGLYDRLNKIFNFTLDPACSKENAKCEKYYTKDHNGLEQDWSDNIVFLNPPYGSEIGKWVKKSYEESRKENTIVVMLIPARTDTRYFHEYIMKAKEIWFIDGRVKFERNGKKGISAPFPSMIVIFDKLYENLNIIKTFNVRKKA